MSRSTSSVRSFRAVCTFQNLALGALVTVAVGAMSVHDTDVLGRLIVQSNSCFAGCEAMPMGSSRDTCIAGCSASYSGTSGTSYSYPSGGSYSMPSGGMTCHQGCEMMPAGASRDMCIAGCNSMPSATTGGTYTAPATGATTSTSGTSGPGSDPLYYYNQCMSTCVTDSCRSGCAMMKPAAGATASPSAGASASVAAAASVDAYAACKDWCYKYNTPSEVATCVQSKCNMMGGAASVSGGDSVVSGTCFYTNAKDATGKSLGFTPQCTCASSDKSSCTCVDHNWKAIPTPASLGPASQCSVYSGGGYSAGGGQSCESMCDKLTVATPTCSSGDMSPMCAKSISECKQRCQGTMMGGNASTGSYNCVEGCKNMTDVMCATATGETKEWCEAKKTGTCEQKCQGMGMSASASRSGMCPDGKEPCYPPCTPGMPCALGFSCVTPGTCNTGTTGGGTSGKCTIGGCGPNADPRCLGAPIQEVPCESDVCKKDATCRPMGGGQGGGGASMMNGEECFKKYCSAMDVSTKEYAQCKNGCFNVGGQQGGYQGTSNDPECRAGCSTVYTPGTAAYMQCRDKCYGAPRLHDGQYQPRPEYQQFQQQYNAQDECARIRQKMEYLRDMPDVMAQVEALYKERCEKGGSKGKTAQQGSEIRNEIDQIQQQVFVASSCEQAKSAIDEASRAISTYAPKMIKQVKNKGTAEKLWSLLETAKGILAEAQGHYQQKQCDKAVADMDLMEERVARPFQDIVMSAGVDVRDDGQFVNYEDDYEDFADRLVDEADTDDQSDEFVGHMKKKGYKSQDLAYLKSIDRDLIKEYLAYTGDDSSKDVVKVAAGVGIGASAVEELLETKNRLLRQIETLQETARTLSAAVRQTITSIEQHIFNPVVAQKVEDLLEQAGSLTPEQMKAGYEKLVQESRRADVAQGITLFEDVDALNDHAWAAKHIREAVEEHGLFRGVDPEGKQFAPGQQANIAQVLTVASRALDLDGEGASAVSGLARSMPEWARGAAAAIEDEGVELADIFGSSKPGDPAARIQIARLFVAAFHLPEGDESVLADFTDLDGLSDEDRAVVAAVASAGIMTGTDGLFNPNGVFDRGQFATVVNRMMEYMEGDEEPTEEALNASAPEADEAAEEEIDEDEKTEEASAVEVPDFEQGMEKMTHDEALTLLQRVQYYNYLMKTEKAEDGSSKYMSMNAVIGRKLEKELKDAIENRYIGVKSDVGVYVNVKANLSQTNYNHLVTVVLPDLYARQATAAETESE